LILFKFGKKIQEISMLSQNFSNFSKYLGLAALTTLVAVPVLAHTVEVSGDVAATFHLAPSHNPRVGQPSQAWFALTQRGGGIIPLSQCDCSLAVHTRPRGTAPILQPVLTEINAEQYRNIPGASMTFPAAGSYDLVLRGTAKNGATFRPFTLTYTVNVGS
jgi:hypothetical protein